MHSESLAPPPRLISCWPLALALAAVGFFYWSTFVSLVQNWELDPNYSHGYLVPFISLGFAWMAWRDFGAPIRAEVMGRDFLIGIGEILLGLVVHAVAMQNLLLDVISLICVLRGILLVLGGREVNRAYGFSILFLVFMGPLPALWYTPLAVVMQQIASAVSATSLELLGVPVFREGYLLHVPGYTMEVGEACSGWRQLVAILAITVVLGHVGKRGWAYTCTLAFLTVPIAIAANCLRVIISGVILLLFGRKWAEGIFHTLEGLAILVVAASLVLLTAWLLGKVWGNPPDAEQSLETVETPEAAESPA